VAEQTYPFTEEGASQALEDLGATPADVAAALAVRGIKGIVNNEYCCPVANYLQTAVGGAEVQVWDVECTLTRRVQVDEYVESEDVVIDTPKPIAVFLSAFDAEEYPDLIEKEPVHV